MPASHRPAELLVEEVVHGTHFAADGKELIPIDDDISVGTQSTLLLTRVSSPCVSLS